MATSPKAVQAQESDESTKKRLRSPAYPFVNLETAIKRAKAFYDREGRNAAPLAVMAKHWGYETKSSGSTQTAAALMSFGLMQDEGTGGKRKVKLTPSALKILLDARTDSSEKDALIKQAALSPKIHQQIWSKWPTGVSDENLKHALMFEWESPFNENSVDGFIREYKDTIAFAKLTESDKVATEDGNNEGASGSAYVPKIGDYVQWESQGVLQFKEPVKVLRLSTDGTHAFVAETATGLPVRQLQRAEAPAVLPQAQNLRMPILPTTTVKEDVYSLPEGRIVVQWPATLSPESVEEVKDYLKLLERKIVRSTVTEQKEQPE